MKFEKVIIDGKEYYREVTDTDAAEVGTDNAADPELIDVEIGDAEEPTGAEKLRRDTEEFFNKVGTGAREFGERFVAGARELGEKIKMGTERLFAKDNSEDPNSREAKLLKILPYLSPDEAHNVCTELIADEKILGELELAPLMPFLSAEDCDALFGRALQLGAAEDDLVAAMKYVSEACASELVDGYIAGKYPELNVDKFYPFLSDANIKKLFYHIINK